MRRSAFTSVALGVAWRQLNNFVKNPAFLIPSMIFPLFFLVAFAGGLSSVGDVPGFGFRSGYTAFQFVWVAMQSAAFGGVFTGFAIAADFENGFMRRLMLAAPSRAGIVAGYALAALARATLTVCIVTLGALLSGMRVDGGAVDLFGLAVLAVVVNIAGTMWGTGVAMRIRSLQGAPLMQTPVFLALFLAPVFVPRRLLEGWIATVARYNPITYLVEAGRGFISGQPDGSAAAFATGAALVALFTAWALTGLRRAERAGS